MQTFLPYPDFYLSSECLDTKRLGKQRVESWQLWMSLTTGNRWAAHPASKMWKGHTNALSNYLRANILVWVARGFNNSMPIPPLFTDAPLPKWFGDEAFHAAHRSNLLRKNPEHYGQFGWTEDASLAYIWPTP